MEGDGGEWKSAPGELVKGPFSRWLGGGQAETDRKYQRNDLGCLGETRYAQRRKCHQGRCRGDGDMAVSEPCLFLPASCTLGMMSLLSEECSTSPNTLCPPYKDRKGGATASGNLKRKHHLRPQFPSHQLCFLSSQLDPSPTPHSSEPLHLTVPGSD